MLLVMVGPRTCVRIYMYPFSVLISLIAALGGGHETYSIYLVDASYESSVKTMSSGSSTTTDSTDNTNNTDNTDTTDTATSTTDTNNPPATETPATTEAEQTVVVTAPSQSEAVSQPVSSENSDTASKSNTAAIAAGVVVGVVGFFALLGAIFFFWRFKKRKSERNFLNTGPAENYNKPMSTSSNSRFDGDFMAQRRQSNGSIDDDQDFSRRILQVIRFCCRWTFWKLTARTGDQSRSLGGSYLLHRLNEAVIFISTIDICPVFRILPSFVRLAL